MNSTPKGDFDYNDEYWRKELEKAHAEQEASKKKIDQEKRLFAKNWLLGRAKSLTTEGLKEVFTPVNADLMYGRDWTSFSFNDPSLLDEINKTTIYQASFVSKDGSNNASHVKIELKLLL